METGAKKSVEPGPSEWGYVMSKMRVPVPGEDYPPLPTSGYATTIRQRRSESERTAEMMREMSRARKADPASMDELVKRVAALGRQSLQR